MADTDELRDFTDRSLAGDRSGLSAFCFTCRKRFCVGDSSLDDDLTCRRL